MRKSLIGVVICLLLWCGWWILGAWAIGRATDNVRAELAADGWEVNGGDIALSGFPLFWNAQITEVTAKQAVTATGVAFERAKVRLPAFWPLSTHIILPPSPITVETPINTYTLRFAEGQARGALRLGAPTTLRSSSFESGKWQINSRQGNIASGAALNLSVTQDETKRDLYTVRFAALALTPGDVLRQAIRLPAGWPRQMSDARLVGAVEIAADAQARLRAIRIEGLSFVWGSLSISGAGEIAIDAEGVPEGSFALLIKNWRQLYELLKENGTINADQEFQTDLMLNGLANIGGDPETLDLELIFRDGDMFLGPILLGPAPRLQL